MVGHKLVGLLYGYTGYVGAAYGFFLSVLIRLELLAYGSGVVRGVKETWMYNGWISAHGVVMLFLFVMPMAIGGYGNYLLPLLIGSSEMVMPRINGVSYWLLAVAVVTALLCQVVFVRPVCSGWTLYPPLVTRDGDALCIATDLTLVCVHVLGLSSGLGAINYLATVRSGRHQGLAWIACNLYVWSLMVTAFLLVGSLPVLGVAITGLLLDRNYGACIHDDMLGGDPVLYQHLFWFFGHPEVYIVILPIFGLVSGVLYSLVHRDVFGREGLVYCMAAIGIVGFCVWAHHMVIVGLDLDSRAYFSAATSVVSIPTSVKVFSYLATLSGSRAALGSSAVWSFLAFLVCFTSGGFTGLVLSSAALDLILHDTYFVVAHFHTVLSLGAVFGLFVAHYGLTALLWGSAVWDGAAILQAWCLTWGVCLIFGPMHALGVVGMSRRVPEYADVYAPYIQTGSIGALYVLLSVLIALRTLSTLGLAAHSPKVQLQHATGNTPACS